MDDKHRVVLTKELRKAAGIEDEEGLVAIPFWGGVVIASPKGKGFAGSLSGFGFEEGRHEGTEYLTKAGKDADSGHSSNLRGR